MRGEAGVQKGRPDEGQICAVTASMRLYVSGQFSPIVTEFTTVRLILRGC